MWRRAVLIGLSLCAAASSALAGEWSAKVRAGQTVETSDNHALAVNPGGETYGFASQLQLSAAARRPGLKFEADADVSYRALAGPGADEVTAPTNNGVRLKLEKVDSLTKYYLAGSWRRQDATSAQFADNGIMIVTGDITTYVVDAGFVRQVTGLDALSWSVMGTSVEFTSLTGAPYTDLTTTGAWTRRLTPTTDFITSLQFEWLVRDDQFHSETLFTRATVGLNTQITKQLALRGAFGVGTHTTDRDGVLPSSSQASDGSVGWLADLQLVYRPAQGAEISVAAAHSMAPSVIGEISTRSTVSAGFRQEISPLSYMAFLGEFVQQSSLDGLAYNNADYFRASITYGYRLTPEWQTQVSYRFAERIDDTGAAQSNTFFFSLVREVVMLP